MKNHGVKWVSMMLMAGLVLGGCGAKNNAAEEVKGSEPAEKKIEFFQWKVEAVSFFDEKIKEFEAANPGVEIEQVNVPDGPAVLKTRVARGDIPDIFISYPIEQDYVLRAQNDYLLDLTNEEFVKNIIPEVQDRYLIDGKMYGVALSQNAMGVIYNKKMFAENKIEIPQTWDEFVATMEKFKQLGITPILMPNATADVSAFNMNLLANSFDKAYWEKANKGEAIIEGDPLWEDIAKKMLVAYDYAQKDSIATKADQINQRFVNGEGAMYVMGTFILPQLEKLNPEFEYGMFPFPATNDKDKNLVLGGVDTGFTISSQAKYPEEAKKFLAFLTSKESAQQFSDYEGSISAVKDVQMNKEQVKQIAELVKEGRSSNWPNHYWHGGTGAENDFRKYSQQFLMSRDSKAYLKNLNDMFIMYKE
ncbi:ABC transporter substrate-binding protein [Paenibacillus sp. FSL R10-2771]|uniref:ABC transporter substrate-binding protein n=1 Tax=Paenibacillus sp. FSL R10-2771 TaxID=2954693 RepID=UPI0030F4D746